MLWRARPLNNGYNFSYTSSESAKREQDDYNSAKSSAVVENDKSGNRVLIKIEDVESLYVINKGVAEYQ